MKISGCIMARNRERTLGAAIDSIKSVIDELIYVDTGSTDRSIEIVKEHYPDAIIYEHPWQDSFSEARNFSFAQCSGDWILQIDSDEVLEPASAKIYRDILEKTESNGVVVTMLNDTVSGGMAWSPVARAFKRGKVHFTFRKHNQPNVEGNLMKFAPYIKYSHCGYNLSPEETAAKDFRDIRRGIPLDRQIEI